MFWILALTIAVVAALFTALPLLRAGRAGVPASANDAEVYRDQLAEVERDAGSGLIKEEEARQARAEIARRLIAAKEAEDGETVISGHRGVALATALFLCLFVPVAGYLLYDRMGMPDAGDWPLAARLASQAPDINILIARTEAHLATHPDDGKAWELLAPIYMRQMRAEDAANAYRNAVRTLGPDPVRLGSLGEALAVGARGEVTPDARKAFEDAVKLDPEDPRSLYYLALADAQSGKIDAALAVFSALRAKGDEKAPWRKIVDDQIARLEGLKKDGSATLGNPGAADIEAASAMSDEDRMLMIRTMVDSLDAKLKDDPKNLEGWKRLIRSYGVLKDPQRAEDALKRALETFPADTANGQELVAMAKDMGLKTEVSEQ